jgi:hypothetical protein
VVLDADAMLFSRAFVVAETSDTGEAEDVGVAGVEPTVSVVIHCPHDSDDISNAVSDRTIGYTCL